MINTLKQQAIHLTMDLVSSQTHIQELEKIVHKNDSLLYNIIIVPEKMYNPKPWRTQTQIQLNPPTFHLIFLHHAPLQKIARTPLHTSGTFYYHKCPT